jgi:membrane protein YdbS with pleckstrin-like domain
MMNQKSLLKDNMPTGGKRIAWNLLMALAAGLASFGSIWSLWSKLRWTGIAILVGFILLAVVVQFVRRGKGDYHHKKMHVS